MVQNQKVYVRHDSKLVIDSTGSVVARQEIV